MTGIKILFDSGSTKTHIKREHIKKLHLRKDTEAIWTMAAGSISTMEKCKVLFSLPEFFPSKMIEWNVYVGTLETIQYDMIIGNDLLEALKVDIKYSTMTIEWDGAEIPMRSKDMTIEELYLISNTPCLQEAAERIKQILDAKYEPANLNEIVKECIHLTPDEQSQLKSLLTKYESLFDGSLGTWIGDDYDIEL
jgi:hypothetical protein